MRSRRALRNISSFAAALAPVVSHKTSLSCEAKQLQEARHGIKGKFSDIKARAQIIKHGFRSKRDGSGLGGPLFNFGGIGAVVARVLLELRQVILRQWRMRSRRALRNISSFAAALAPVVSHKTSLACEAKQLQEARHGMKGKFSDIEARAQIIKHGFQSKRDASGLGGPLFSFGVIADIQHADIEDATNFGGTEKRQYRGALHTAREAVRYWEDKNLSFVAQLGDLIDGQNAGKYGEGKKFADQPQSWNAVERVFDELCGLDRSIPYLHAIGNHELYNFSMEDLEIMMGISGPIADSKVQSPSPFYYSFSPHPGWRIIMLNAFEWSVSLPEGSEGRTKAEQMLRANHPNAEKILSSQGTVDYFEGLSGMGERFVPFNGAFGEDQLCWLKETLTTASKDNERVIILTHLPLHPLSCNGSGVQSRVSARNLAYDAPEVLNIIWENGSSCVAAILSGHAHRGGYFSEPSSADHVNLTKPLSGEPCDSPPGRAGLHHVVLQGALTHKHAYGHIAVYSDRLELVGAVVPGMSFDDATEAGFIPSRTLLLEPMLSKM